MAGSCVDVSLSLSLSPPRFGPPFLMREDRSISWDQLQQSVLSKLYYLMINGAQAQVANHRPPLTVRSIPQPITRLLSQSQIYHSQSHAFAHTQRHSQSHTFSHGQRNTTANLTHSLTCRGTRQPITRLLSHSETQPITRLLSWSEKHHSQSHAFSHSQYNTTANHTPPFTVRKIPQPIDLSLKKIKQSAFQIPRLSQLKTTTSHPIICPTIVMVTTTT